MGGDALEDSILPNKDNIFEVKPMNMDYIPNPMSAISFFSQINTKFLLPTVPCH